MKKTNNPYIKNSDHLSNSDKDNFTEINEFYETNKDIINTSENFPLFIRRQSLSYYLAKYELYKKTLDIKGSIVECGSYKDYPKTITKYKKQEEE